MLISDEKAFLFVHVPKTAGRSIDWALRSYAYRPNRGKWNRLLSKWDLRRDYRSRFMRAHASFRDAERVIPADRLAGLFKFAFVRNPWDRLVSLYAYMLGWPDHPHHEEVRRLSGFAEYLPWEIARAQPTQHALLVDSTGKLAVDFLGRFESLERDFAIVCARLGIEAELPQRNRSTHEPYETYYTSELVELVARHWREDIAAFDYTFSGPLRERSSPDT